MTTPVDAIPPASERPEPWSGERADTLAKVTGKAKYLDDLDPPDGTLHAAALRSPYSHARIVSIDSSKAEAYPGVRGVFHRDRLDGLDAHLPIVEHHLGLKPWEKAKGLTGEQHLIAVDKVRFHGDIVAMVAADDLRTARAAAGMIEVDYEVLSPLFSFSDAIAPGAPILHEDLGTNVAFEDSLEWGDLEAGFEMAETIVEGEFSAGNVYHHPMEPATSCLVRYGESSIDVWTSVSKAFSIEPHVAALFGVAPEQVRVQIPDIGGGFGAKQLAPSMLIALALSRQTGRPVRYLVTNEEGFRSNSRHAMVYRGRMGIDGLGQIVALDVDLEVDTGAYYTGATIATHNACISAWGCYKIPAFRVRARAAFTNKVPAGPFRATGKTQTTFAVESLIDVAARRVGIDPTEFRRRNVIQRGEYITDTWRVRGEEFSAKTTPPMDSDFEELIERAVDAIGWDGVSATQPRFDADTTVARGRGLALSFRHGSQGGGRTYAMVTVDRDGKVRVLHNAPDLGTGVYNMLRIVAAETLGLPVDAVEVAFPDTSNRLSFEGTSAQRTTVQMGRATQDACENLKRELAIAAFQVFGGAAEDWTLVDGRVSRNGVSYSLGEVVSGFQGHVTLKALGSYSYAPSEDKAFGGLDHWAPGAAAAEVEVDLETGEIRILRYGAVADAGKAIHVPSTHAQVLGGAVLGIGISLFEDLIYSDGQLLTSDAIQYRLPTMRDIPPHFVSSLVENEDGPGPFGSKGMSQTSIPCVAPAVANAVADAIGVRLTDTPFTPEKVLRATGRLGS